MRGRILGAAVAACTIVAAAGCGSSSKPPTSTGKGAVTIGVLTDETGISSSSNKTTVQGVQAGVVRAAGEGYHVHIVVADTGSSFTGTLQAAQQLVEQHHVAAVIANSSFTFEAKDFLTAHGVPVIGAAEDGSEWIAAPNMFSVYGAIDTTKVSTMFGKFLESRGVTNLASIGYSISPASAEAAKANARSAEHVGIRVGYLNPDFPFGSTNVGPDVLAMKDQHVDGFTGALEPNTDLALITGLRQQGVSLKAAILATGYGGDTLDSGPAGIEASQGLYFFTSFEPIEMHTAATRRFSADLGAIGVRNDPTYAEYVGYASVAMLVQAMQAAGHAPTSATILAALEAIKSYNAWGLFGSNSFEPSAKATQAIGSPPCVYYTQLAGTTFKLVSGADPICGTEIPGVTVSASS